MEPLTALGVLIAAQGLVGSVQYELQLPTEMVWIHVGLATVTWLVILWSVAAAGRLVPRAAPQPHAASEPRADGVRVADPVAGAAP
jgi:heme A synthase